METALTKKLKTLTHYFRPRMSITTRSIRWADEVWTPTGIVDSIRFEDYHVDDECLCRLIDSHRFTERMQLVWGQEYPKGFCFRDGSTDKSWKKCAGCYMKARVGIIGMMITCYEVKISYSDFKSKNGHNFHGNENYYVVPAKLAKKIVEQVPSDIGIIAYHDGGSMRILKPCSWRQVSDETKLSLLYNAFKKWVDGASFPGGAEPIGSLPQWTDTDEINLLNNSERRDESMQDDNLQANGRRRNHERSIALEEAAKPLVDFVNTQCCPHDMIVIQQGSVELFSGEISMPTPIPD